MKPESINSTECSTADYIVAGVRMYPERVAWDVRNVKKVLYTGSEQLRNFNGCYDSCLTHAMNNIANQCPKIDEWIMERK